MATPSWLIEFERKLYEENEFNNFLGQIEARAGVPRLYAVIDAFHFQAWAHFWLWLLSLVTRDCFFATSSDSLTLHMPPLRLLNHGRTTTTIRSGWHIGSSSVCWASSRFSPAFSSPSFPFTPSSNVRFSFGSWLLVLKTDLWSCTTSSSGLSSFKLMVKRKRSCLPTHERISHRFRLRICICHKAEDDGYRLSGWYW